MRNLKHLDPYRVRHPLAGMGDEHSGAFMLKLDGSKLIFSVIASTGMGWDHVSVSAEERCPKWNEMQQIKELFFKDDEVVIQLHPAKENYINHHPNCLHLWRPQHQNIPLPDPVMV